MLDMRELDAAIAELEARPATLSGCAKLADLYAVRDHLAAQRDIYMPERSAAAEPPAAVPAHTNKAGLHGDSDFLVTVAGKDAAKAWQIIDELMDTLRIVNARVYESYMQKIRRI